MVDSVALFFQVLIQEVPDFLMSEPVIYFVGLALGVFVIAIVSSLLKGGIR